MENLKNNPQNIGFIVLGIALMVVGISSDNNGLMAAGIVFIVIGFVARKGKSKQGR